ncbi:MAG: hypothetical protein ACYCW6_21010 [Candidatus Xenobia bacterium]
MNPDFSDMLSALSEAGAEFLIVGAYALAAYGSPRATGDLDIWVRPTPENAQRVWLALARFGAPLNDLTVAELSAPDVVFQIGVVPCRIDILTAISGVAFDDAWPARVMATVEGRQLPFIGKSDFIRNKRATGRLKDLADAALLEAQE